MSAILERMADRLGGTDDEVKPLWWIVAGICICMALVLVYAALSGSDPDAGDPHREGEAITSVAERCGLSASQGRHVSTTADPEFEGAWTYYITFPGFAEPARAAWYKGGWEALLCPT